MVIKIDKNIKYFKIKNPLESIGALFSKISLIKPDIFKDHIYHIMVKMLQILLYCVF